MKEFFNKVAGCAGYHTGRLSDTEQLLVNQGIKFRKKWNGEIIVKGSLNLEKWGLKALPDFSNVIVQGTFSCIGLGLTSLKGAPKRVEDAFHCSDNPLVSLEGSPQFVGDSFFCTNCGLETLEGGPQHVGRDVVCEKNKLRTLRGAPQFVGENFHCENNELVSLEGAPEKVGGLFWCGHNKLVTLKGAPRVVGDSFWCNDNQLTSLEGGPESVRTSYCCSKNQLTSFIGVAQDIGEIYGEGNPLVTIEGAPQTKARIRSDFGDFWGWDAVPEEHRWLPGTHEKRETERHTVLQNAIQVSRPLRLKRQAGFLGGALELSHP